MCESKLASGALFLMFFQLQLLLWTRILLFWVSKTYYLEACCLHFTTLGTILSAWGHPGGPWEQQEGHMGVRSKIFSDFGLILGRHFESFLSSDGLNSVFFWSLFPGHFLRNYWQLELLEQGFRVEGIAKTMFSQKLCFGVSRVDFFCVFWKAWGYFF